MSRGRLHNNVRYVRDVIERERHQWLDRSINNVIKEKKKPEEKGRKEKKKLQYYFAGRIDAGPPSAPDIIAERTSIKREPRQPLHAIQFEINEKTICYDYYCCFSTIVVRGTSPYDRATVEKQIFDGNVWNGTRGDPADTIFKTPYGESRLGRIAVVVL